MTYYIKGGSRFNEANPTVWVALNLLGFADSKYLDADWKQIDFESIVDDDDPFWLMGSTTGGAKELELGLYNDYRIKFETTGITYWDGDSWEDLLALGGATNLVDLGDVVITTPADNEVLAYNNATSKWINQTAAEAGIATSGHGHGQLHDQNHDNTYHSTNYHTEADGTGAVTVHSGVTDAGSGIIISDAERTALHAIYTLESHDNAYHSTNYEPAFTKNTGFNKDFGVITGTVAEGDDSRFHTIYSLESHDNTYHSTNYEAEFSKNTAFNKNFGTLGTEVCVGNDSRLSDARTPTSHNFDVHSGDVDLADLADYTAGRIIYGGATDWQFLALGTTNYVLKAGATYPAWGQVDYSELVGTQPAPIAHALNTSGPHTGPLQLTDLGSYAAQGDLIFGGVSDWSVLTKGTTNYVLKAGATTISWGQVDWSELTGSQPAPISHDNTYHSTNYHTESDGTGVATVHSDIVNTGSQSIITTAERNALHAIYTDANARTATLESTDYPTDWDGDDDHAPTQDALFDLIDGKIFKADLTFPVSPIEGQLYYDTVDEAMYRYSVDALAWIQIGGAGVGSNTALTLEQARTNSNQISGQIDMNQNLIIDLPTPVSDTDVANKKYAKHGIASNDLIFSNDTERSSASPPMTKIKEITIYRSTKLRVYWEHKCNVGGVTISNSRVYVNGVAVGSLHSNLTTSYVAFTEDIEVNAEDTIEIWAMAFTDVPVTVYIRYQRLKLIEYVSTGGY